MTSPTRAETEAALRACEQAVARNSSNLIAWHNMGVELRRLDRLEEALAAIETALAGGLQAPETAVMRAHLLGDFGRFDEAVSAYHHAIAIKPDLIDAHETLSRLLPQIGRRAEAFDAYHNALRASPGSGALWVSALSAAKDMRDADQLFSWIADIETRFGPEPFLNVLAAQAYSWQGQDVTAMDRLRSAIAIEPENSGAQATLAHVAVRLGDMAMAETAALNATRIDPTNQSAWALLTVIWRLTGDPREHWLADYRRFVMPIDLRGIDLAATATALNARHVTRVHPADQSLRGGTQTRGNLFDKSDPAIVALRRSIEGAMIWAIATLPRDPDHPFLKRITEGATFAGSWSVRLSQSGFHISHIHQNGWLSSAAYIALPSDVDGTSDSGALAFGIPDAELKQDLPPRRVVRPRVGQLVLFPSYLWHGTLPFAAGEPRLTVAFDALPV
ncbi:MAG: putative 2OG-Fe(II) oxygenase [Sphingomonadales bacterium]